MPPAGHQARVNTTRSEPAEGTPLVYQCALPLSRQTLTFVADLLRAHLKKIASRWRKLPPGKIALIVLATLRHDHRWPTRPGAPAWRTAASARSTVGGAGPGRCHGEATSKPAPVAAARASASSGNRRRRPHLARFPGGRDTACP
jgi:hypothetical protein